MSEYQARGTTQAGSIWDRPGLTSNTTQGGASVSGGDLVSGAGRRLEADEAERLYGGLYGERAQRVADGDWLNWGKVGPRVTGAVNQAVQAQQGKIDAARQEVASPPQPADELPDMPDTSQMTPQQRYERYRKMAADNGISVDRAPGEQFLLALRVSTDTTVNRGRGAFDDRMVVLWVEQSPNGGIQYHAEEFNGWNTEPSAQYDQMLGGKQGRGQRRPMGKDANGDGARDLGCLPHNQVYTMVPDRGRDIGPIGDRVLRPVSDIPVWRDVNHDGHFDGEDDRLLEEHRDQLVASGMSEQQAQKKINDQLNSEDTVLVHRGSRANTDSAACQTTQGKPEFDRLWHTLGDPDPNAPLASRPRFAYAIIRVK